MDGHHHDMASLGCNGEELGHEYGSWIGHVLPGALFITWGSWHLLNVFWAYTRVMARDGHDARFRSQANYKLHVGPGREWPVEAVLKVVGAVVGMSMELWTGGSYQALVCENHTAHPGWFHGDNINNWQHAILYPPILLSGLVDLLSSSVVLPRGAQHGFLALVFLFEGLIMGSHTKPVPLDNVVHQYLAATSTTLALVTLLETFFLSRNALLAAARASLMVLQGTWLCAIGRIMFEHRVAWDTHLMAPHDYVPVLYCWHVVFIAAGALGLYTCVAMWQQYVQPRLDVDYSPLHAHGGKDAHGLPVVEHRHHEYGVPRAAAGGVARHQRRASGSEGSSDIEMSSEVTPAGSDHESASGDHHDHDHHDGDGGSERRHLLLGVRGEPRPPQPAAHAGRYGAAPIAL